MGIWISTHKILTLLTVALKSNLNGKSSNVNIEDLHLANPQDILETEDISINNWERKGKLSFRDESLPVLQWQMLQPKRTNKSCRTVQPSRVCIKSDSCKLLPRKVYDEQDAGKHSEPVATGSHIDR